MTLFRRHATALPVLSLILGACSSDDEGNSQGAGIGTGDGSGGGIPMEGAPLPLSDLEGLYSRTDVPDNAEMLFVTADGGLRFYTLDGDIGNFRRVILSGRAVLARRTLLD